MEKMFLGVTKLPLHGNGETNDQLLRYKRELGYAQNEMYETNSEIGNYIGSYIGNYI